jgi:hypothetical protein
MSTQAAVHSIDALKDFRVALALFSDDALAALGAVDMEARRTLQWLQHNRRAYWHEQIKKRREKVAEVRAEVFRRKLAKKADYAPIYGEQKDLLRQAEASLRDAELRANLVKKWEPALQQAVLEYHGSTRRIKDLASGEVPRALILLERMIDALEAYLRVSVPSSAAAMSPFESIAGSILDDAVAVSAGAEPETQAASPDVSASAESATEPADPTANPEPPA